jgi:hypothetical protein
MAGASSSLGLSSIMGIGVASVQLIWCPRFLAAPQTQMNGQIGSKIRPALSADWPSAGLRHMKQRAVCRCCCACRRRRQRELEQAARQILGELGPNASTEFLIAVTSDRTKVEPDEIVEAISAVNGRGKRHPSSLQSTAGLRRSQTPTARRPEGKFLQST